MALIRLNHLTVSFDGFKAVDDLSAELSGSVCGLIGPNGAGKTTLVNALCGLVSSTGSFALNGSDCSSLSPIARVRRGLRRSFQTEQVVQDLSAWDNVKALLDHLPAQPPSEAEADIVRALEFSDLLAVANNLGASLNLFERRRLEFAKALVGGPELILMDEPGAGLTEHESHWLMEAIMGIPKISAAQILLIDHDVNLIAAVCNQTMVLDFGRCLAIGETQAVLADAEVRRAYLGS